MSATALLAQNPNPSEDEVRTAIQGNICRCTGYVNIVEAIVSRGRHEHDRDVTEPADARRRDTSGSRSRARRTGGSSRVRVSSSTTSAGTGWATSTSSARRMRTRRSSRSTSRTRSSSTACTGRSRATRSRSTPTRSSRCPSSRGRTSRTTRSPSAAFGTWASRSPRSCAATRELARDAAELIEVEYEPLPVLVDAAEALKDETVLHDDAGSNVVWSASSTGATVDAALAEADHVVKIDELHFHRFSSTPLECAGALVEYDKGTGQWTLTAITRCPGVGAIWMAPALRTGIDKLRFVTHDIGGGFGNKICLHPHYVVALPAGAEARPPGAVDRVAHRPAHGERARQRALVLRRRGRGDEGRDDDRLQGARRSTTAARSHATSRSAASSGRRLRRGSTGWRNIRVDFTQVCTNKSPVSPNRGYSRMQHLWLTERIIDIVAAELDLDPVEIRKRNYVKAEQMPYETPNGCFYDSGDYSAALDIALELIDARSRSGARRRPRAGSSSGSGSARRSTRERTTSASRRS